ncbi:MAG: zf-HC2 domain-containing protein [Singulisphaera sp.]
MEGCPSAEDLRRFLAEELGDSDRRAIESHVRECERCQELLDRLPSDSADELRGVLQDSLPAIPPRTPGVLQDSPPVDRASTNC